MVNQEKLHDPCLSLLRHLTGVLGLHHHAIADWDRAGGLWLSLALNFNQAHSAGSDRVQQRMITEPRNCGSQHFGYADD
jgi:hypothetical protein